MTSQVASTNDCSISSKRSMVASGYFQDDSIQYLCPKFKRRSPLINIGYCTRAVVINEGISFFLRVTGFSKCQIVSLGAGFDSSYFRLASCHDNVYYYEIDFDDVVKNKIQLIKNSPELSRKINNLRETSKGVMSDNYCLLAQDMSCLEEFENTLLKAGLDTHKPTLFLSECAITYMEEKSSTAIIKWASSLKDVVFIIYEQISPYDGFGNVMTNHFASLASPLKSIKIWPTKEAQKNRYLSCGYDYAWSIGAFEMFKKILSTEEHERLVNLEPFDEWEEWHLTSAHYTLSGGIKGIFCNPYSKEFVPLFESVHQDRVPCKTGKWLIEDKLQLQLYGHSATPIWQCRAVLILGGFGLNPVKKHSRLSQICLISPDLKVSYITPPQIDGATWDCMHHSCSLLFDDPNKSLVLLFGGRTSPQRNVNANPIVLCIEKIDASEEPKLSARIIQNNDSGPSPRRRHSASRVEDSTFIYGGISTDPDTSKLKVFGDAWILTKEEIWMKLESKPEPRFSHSATVINSEVYIVGGLGRSFEALRDIWVYSFQGHCWTEIQLEIIPRYGHTCHALNNNSIIIVGGVNGLSENQPGYCCINLVENSAIEYTLPESPADHPIMLHNHASIIYPNKSQIRTIGGGGTCFSFGSSFNRHSIIIEM